MDLNVILVGFVSYTNAYNYLIVFVAHGEAELKERPKKLIEETTAEPLQRNQTRSHHHFNNENITQVDTQNTLLADQRNKWRSSATGTQNQSESSVKPR
jgi:hypothetical protein